MIDKSENKRNQLQLEAKAERSATAAQADAELQPNKVPLGASPKTPAPAVPAPATAAGTMVAPAATMSSAVAIARHLDAWASRPRLIGFNGQDGIYSILDDGTEVPAGTEFIALLDHTRKGWIKFNGEGEKPETVMVGIGENKDVPTRDELGDLDQSQWPLSRDGKGPEDPWKPQYDVPLLSTDAGGELFGLVMRGVTAMNAVRSLLGRYRWHPKAKQGLYPIVRLDSGTYLNKRFGGRRPKPVLSIVDWVTKDGAPPPPPAPLAGELNDQISF
jgi:hypothetical protein